MSIVGKDLQSETRVNGFITIGEIACPSAAAGAWVGGLFGLLAGTALLFIPGAGPLVVLGPLATAAVGAAQGALIGGGVGEPHLPSEPAERLEGGPEGSLRPRPLCRRVEDGTVYLSVPQNALLAEV